MTTNQGIHNFHKDIIEAVMDNQESKMQLLERQILSIEMMDINLANEIEVKKNLIQEVINTFFGIKPVVNYELPY